MITTEFLVEELNLLLAEYIEDDIEFPVEDLIEEEGFDFINNGEVVSLKFEVVEDCEVYWNEESVAQYTLFFPDLKCHVSISGWYNSFADDVDWSESEFFLSKAVERTVIEYLPIEEDNG